MTNTNLIRITTCGPVQGKAAQPGVTAFRGIPYATAGRWEYPKLVTQWEGTLDGTNFGPVSMQMNAIMPEEASGRDPFYYHEFREGLPYTYSEDSLSLNIYAPDDAEKAPVLVYIHGGAFMGGSGWDKVFDEPLWPLDGVIAVTLNYRLGLFGALTLPELTEEAGRSGNYQIYDQKTALEWIYRNISAFGGDPDNITLMGQSAGARSVQMQIGSPKNKGIIKHAALSSGGGWPCRLFGTMPSLEERYAFWKQWMGYVGVSTLEELRQVPAPKLMGAFGQMFAAVGFQNAILMISPTFDEADFPDPDTEAGGWLEIPCILGANSEDLGEGLTEDAHQFASSRPVTSYAYHFCRQLPGDDKGAWHSADLWYWFGTLAHGWRPWEEGDWNLTEKMRGYLLAFARTGNPNYEGAPEWKPARDDEQPMILDI